MSDSDDDPKSSKKGAAGGKKPVTKRMASSLASAGVEGVEDGIGALFAVGDKLMKAIKGVRF
jgi:hypothetical protein